MWLREQGHVFDWGTLKWCQSYTTAPNGCYDAETIALDEFGHVEGLDHHANYADDRDYEDAVVQTYSRTKPAAGWNARAFGACDQATLQRRYDVPSWTAKYSTCASLATTVDGDRLAGVGGLRRDRHGHRHPQGRRRRWLRAARQQPAGRPERHAPTAGHRDDRVGRRGDHVGRPTSGTYVASARLVTGSEFRAVFSTPANEGLRGDTSRRVPGRRRRLCRLHLPARPAGRRPGPLKGIEP